MMKIIFSGSPESQNLYIKIDIESYQCDVFLGLFFL